MIKLNTLSYVYGQNDTIEVGEEYYFGQLWDGNGDGEELLESGAIAVYQDGEEYIVDFEIWNLRRIFYRPESKLSGLTRRQEEK